MREGSWGQLECDWRQIEINTYLNSQPFQLIFFLFNLWKHKITSFFLLFLFYVGFFFSFLQFYWWNCINFSFNWIFISLFNLINLCKNNTWINSTCNHFSFYLCVLFRSTLLFIYLFILNFHLPFTLLHNQLNVINMSGSKNKYFQINAKFSYF